MKSYGRRPRRALSDSASELLERCCAPESAFLTRQTGSIATKNRLIVGNRCYSSRASRTDLIEFVTQQHGSTRLFDPGKCGQARRLEMLPKVSHSTRSLMPFLHMHFETLQRWSLLRTLAFVS